MEPSEYGADTDAGVQAAEHAMGEEYQCEYLTNEVFDMFLQWWASTSLTVSCEENNKKDVFTRDRQPKAAAYVLIDERWETK